MKSFMLITLILILMVPAVCLAGSYASVEFYPTGNLFGCAGRDSLFIPRLGCNIWTTPGTEVAFSVGPKIGPFQFGSGLSFGDIGGDKIGVMYVNFDASFGLDFGPIHWQSYDLMQFGQHGAPNFLLLREWITCGTFPVGLIGHLTKNGDEALNPRVGPFVELGKVGPFSSARLCAAFKLGDTNERWFALICSF
ncbi:MAG: hypothetical protein WC528_02940 [Patescibacteria group bacterium]